MTSHGSTGPAASGEVAAEGGRQAASVEEGMQHLQRAARESIAAMRAFLDVADELLGDPRTLEALLSGLAPLSDLAKAGIVDKQRSSPRNDAGGDDDGGVQRIPVS
jgi:hypothetical protein